MALTTASENKVQKYQRVEVSLVSLVVHIIVLSIIKINYMDSVTICKDVNYINNHYVDVKIINPIPCG